MALLSRFRTDAGPAVVFECRHCGTTVDGTDEHCPTCESAEIARYEF